MHGREGQRRWLKNVFALPNKLIPELQLGLLCGHWSAQSLRHTGQFFTNKNLLSAPYDILIHEFPFITCFIILCECDSCALHDL